MKDRIFLISYIFFNSFLNLGPNIYYYVDNFDNFTIMEKNYFDYTLLYNICLSFCQYAFIYSTSNKYNNIVNGLAIFLINLTILIFNISNVLLQPMLELTLEPISLLYSLNAAYYLLSEIILVAYIIVWCHYNKFNRVEYEKHIQLIDI